MSDISSLHTPVPTSTPTPTQATGPLGTPLPGAAGNFLDLLMCALTPFGAQIVSVHTPQDTGSTTPKDPGLLTPIIANGQDVLTPNDDIDLTVDSPITAILMATSPVIQEVKPKMVISPETDPILSGGPSPISALNTPLQAQIAALDTVVAHEGQNEEIVPVFSPVTLAENKNTPMPLVSTTHRGDVLQQILGPKPVVDTLNPSTETATRNLAAQLNAISVGDHQQQKIARGEKSTDILSTLFAKSPANDTGYMGNLGAQPISYDALGAAQKNAAAPAHLTPSTQSATLLDSTAPVIPDPLFDLSARSDFDVISSAPLQPGTTSAQHSTAVSTTQGASSHASVQAVALHLQQLAQNRETRSLTLQLNPPELGRMQVKMTYGRDKSVKADILVEKSDTFNLMKSDAHTLRDALSNAGLQADSASLNFSLADQGTFTEREQTGGSRAQGGATTLGDDVIGAIEIRASEEWSVDPRTGIVRYNIIV